MSEAWDIEDFSEGDAKVVLFLVLELKFAFPTNTNRDYITICNSYIGGSYLLCII